MNVVMMPRDRESWTDERLDDLNHKVDEGFGDMRAEFRAMRAESREEFRAVRGELASSRRALIQVGAAIWVTSLFGFLGVIVTQT